MADKPVDPTTPPGSAPAPQGPGSAGKTSGQPSYHKGKIAAKEMTWLGMHFTAPEAEKLWTAIMQQINTQIKHDQEKALKAIRKLRKSETGEGGGDDDG